MALARNLEVVGAMKASDWEITSHGLLWIDYQNIDFEIEREHMRQAIEIHEQVTGSKPQGWYTGRSSANTQQLVIENGDFLYDSDSYADDLPYWVNGKGNPHLVVPYTLDTNDMRFATNQGFNCGDQFFTYLRDSFDTLYAEGPEEAKMMSIGLHCRLVGRPGRIASLARFPDYIDKFDDVWVCRRDSIAKHWREDFSP